MIKVELKFKNIDELNALTEMLRTGFKEETDNINFFSDDEKGMLYSKTYAKALIQIIGTMAEANE